MIPSKIWKVLQRRHVTAKNKLVMSNQLIEKLTICKKTGIQPKVINLSKQYLAQFQILLLTKEPRVCPARKQNVSGIKSDHQRSYMDIKTETEIFGK